ncbi:MAG: bifunctional N-acetyltransferase/class I SAM-dependent methyltransferase [Oscillospiraceae bacterium]|nr:bifunctional N-acetyltransferase/class I SAM-dependent methyltransferase [Oscillospiraceae bacterium]
MLEIINIRDHPKWLDPGTDYFASRWNIDKQLYYDSIKDSLTTQNPVPRWYLLLRDEEIIGGFGLIENDFMVGTDLSPWLCALYIEPNERGQNLGASLLDHGVYEAEILGFTKVYLNTDHIGYFEKYFWNYIGDFPHQSGVDARVYEYEIDELEEMSAFFNIRADSYDSHMLEGLGLEEFYEKIADYFETPIKRILDLGSGTGLELESLFELYPEMEATCIDLSQEMLNILADKFAGKKLNLICGSFFDEDFGGPFDNVISTYALHHFDEKEKLELYTKIYNAMAPGAQFILGDYTVKTLERQKEILAAYEKIFINQGLNEDTLYHYDLPFTVETEIGLMKEAGFASTEIAEHTEYRAIIIARK